MRRFHFSLDRILSLRKHEEHEVEMRLAGVTAQCVDLQNKIDEASSQLDGTYGVGTIRGGRIDVSQGYALGAYHAYLQSRIERLTRDLQEKERERAEIAEEYREAYKKRKVLDNLRERRAQEYYAEARRHEGSVLDDIGGANHYFRSEREA
jgi:flagellar protein FliJ